MEYEESLRVLSTVARRVQVMEKGLHDLYWDVDQLVQQLMNTEIERQKNAEKSRAERAEKVKAKEGEKKS